MIRCFLPGSVVVVLSGGYTGLVYDVLFSTVTFQEAVGLVAVVTVFLCLGVGFFELCFVV